MKFLKAIHKDGYEEKYAIPGFRFYWLHNGSWERGSVSWEEMFDDLQAAGIKVVEWIPTADELDKLEAVYGRRD